MAVDVREFKRGMRQLASAVCVITTCDSAQCANAATMRAGPRRRA